jgi:hypothetical protein
MFSMLFEFELKPRMFETGTHSKPSPIFEGVVVTMNVMSWCDLAGNGYQQRTP